jgi:hypothetical protein
VIGRARSGLDSGRANDQLADHPMYNEDYILRMVQQIAVAIARIAGLNQQAKHDDALAAADRV